ncbi:MAG: hypothetical protein GQE15_31910 [Archangiaceae bacterium]|nr:hypothetical protein [Archangiaceae bacterium]
MRSRGVTAGSDDREPSGSRVEFRTVVMVVVGVVTLAMVGLVLVMLDPDRRWTPKVHFRPVLVDGVLHLERCGAWSGARRWWCFIDVDSVSEFEFDVDGDQRSDVRALFWDGRRPGRCIDLRPNRRFSALDSASCCCLQIGCADFDAATCQGRAP